MLIIMAHNDGTAGEGLGNYDVEVRVNHRLIWIGRIEGHIRDEGWQKLLALISEKGSL